MSFELNINGKIYKVGEEVGPTTTLLTFIRDHAKLKGTKGTCYEGGCGACTIVATFVDQETGKDKTLCIKSCQTLVYSCAGWIIETVEYLGSRYRGYHSIQKALVGFSGTQCGFCSPGFIMTMYGKLKSKNGVLTKKEVEDSLDGNICRCTGYRPILDAFKSLAVDAPPQLLHKLQDIEESYATLCSKTGEFCRGQCSEGGEELPDCSRPKLSPNHLDKFPKTIMTTAGIAWHKPTTLKNLYEIISSNPNDKSLRMVLGNTGEGVYKSEAPPDAFVDISSVPELFSVAIGKPLSIGANVSIERCIDLFREVALNYAGYEYLNELADHWTIIANLAIRGVGSWAGNLMLKHLHKEFPSDIFVTLAVAEAVITVGNSSDASTTEVSVEDFLDLDMSKSVIVSMKLLPVEQNIYIRTYKITPRWVNAAAYVNAGFRFHLDPKDGYKILSKPSLVFGGINPTFIHAKKTEVLITSKALASDVTIQAAIRSLAEEVLPDVDPLSSSPEHRKSLSQSLFYKAVLSIIEDVSNIAYRSGGTKLQRPLSTGRQDFDLNKDSWPVGQAIPKVEGNIQVSGEAEYVEDMEPVAEELYGAFVQSTVAKATLDSVDPTEALKLDGVVAFISAKDIPGLNSFYPYGHPDTIFVATDVQYHGQSIGLIVAIDKELASKAAKLVKVTYKNVQTPRIGFGKKIINNSEVSDDSVDDPPPPPPPPPPPDVPTNTAEGEFEQGSQFHFQMEPLAARVIPVEDGYDVYCTTQWPAFVQTTLSEVLGINTNSINISVKRIGGGFGGKISRPNLVASAAAVASHKLQKPVRVTLDLTTHMTLVGWRDPYYTNYKVEFDNEGIFQRVNIKLTADAGFTANETSASYIFNRIPNVYYSPKWGLSTLPIHTDTAANTPCRTPGTPDAIAAMENVIERVAAVLKKDPCEIREKNFIDTSKNQDQPFKPSGENLVRTKIFPMLKEQSNYVARRAEIDNFNKVNRWKKRGISMVPLFYPYGYPKSFRYNTQVIIYEPDGMVALSHGGIEMGQGLNTKAIQVAAKFLKIPVNYIKTKAAHSITGANSKMTAGSFGSDLVSFGIQKCCEKLRQRIDVIFNEMKVKNNIEPTWQELIHECYKKDVDLCERFWTGSDTHPGNYDIFAAVCMEVELDVLTGQYMMLRTDLIEDCGRSLSPYVDIGQIEGAFIMGLGLFTTEKVVFDLATGQKLTNRTWNYKPPMALDIPTDLRITLLPKGDNEHGVLRSKATGEPALCLAYCVITAMRHAITSARADAGLGNWFEITAPLTVERAHQLCKTNETDYVLKPQGKNLQTETDLEDHEFILIPKDLHPTVEEVKESSCSLN